MARLGGVSKITHEQFMLREMRLACRLREEGLSDDELVARVRAENLFQYPTERMLRSKARTCVSRMNALSSPELVHVLATGSREAAAQADLYAMMCDSPLVRDFMVREVARHYRDLDRRQGVADTGAYLARLAERYENVAGLSDLSRQKARQVLRRCLVECGMLASARSDELLSVPLDPEVRAAIESKGDLEALAAFGQDVDMGAAPAAPRGGR